MFGSKDFVEEYVILENLRNFYKLKFSNLQIFSNFLKFFKF